jgi:predicted DNA-binding ribbon-helix-helix protein
METQNITLSLPKRTLKRIKQIAAQRQTSVSALLSDMLEELADQETGYARARQRQLASLEKGFDLGLKEKRPPSRDELHER